MCEYVISYNVESSNFTLGTPKLTKDSADIIDDLYRDRIRTLVSVDDLVEEVVKTLEVMIIIIGMTFKL